MKKQRRLTRDEANPEENDAADEVDDGDDVHAQSQAHLSRKERQKAAKAAEREERKLFEEQRREQQRNLQEVARREKKERERLEVERIEKERKLRFKEREAREQAARDEWSTFMISRDGEEVMTVAEFVDLGKEHKAVSIDGLSDRFQRPSEQIVRRINELVNSCRVTGIVDRGRFIYITPDEMAAIATAVLDEKELSLKDTAKLARGIIKL